MVQQDGDDRQGVGQSKLNKKELLVEVDAVLVAQVTRFHSTRDVEGLKQNEQRPKEVAQSEDHRQGVERALVVDYLPLERSALLQLCCHHHRTCYQTYGDCEE